MQCRHCQDRTGRAYRECAPDFRLSVCSETYGAMLGTPSLTAKSMYCPGGAILLLGGPVQAILLPEEALQSSTTYTRILPLYDSTAGTQPSNRNIMARRQWHNDMLDSR